MQFALFLLNKFGLRKIMSRDPFISVLLTLALLAVMGYSLTSSCLTVCGRSISSYCLSAGVVFVHMFTPVKGKAFIDLRVLTEAQLSIAIDSKTVSTAGLKVQSDNPAQPRFP